ncbi:MAG: hypothetical protein R3E95_01210 [Thiolinea sp.]
MEKEFRQLNKHLDKVIEKMQKIQAKIAASEEPASMHELDTLTRLGKEYSETVEQIAQLQSGNKKEV